MDYPYLGCVLPWPLSWAPQGWALCVGQTLQVQSNSALFSIIGNVFGGDGKTTFMLPDLRGRYIMGAQANTVNVGFAAGAPTVTLTAQNMQPHSHALGASTTTVTALPIATTDAASTPTPAAGNYFAKLGTLPPGATPYTTTGTADTAIQGLAVTAETPTVSNTGASLPVPLAPPYTALPYIICVSGYYPQRP